MKTEKQLHRKRYLFLILILCIPICVYGYMIYLNKTSPVITAKEGYIDATRIEDTSKPYLLTGQWLEYEGLYTPKDLSKQEGEYVRDIQYRRNLRGKTYAFSMEVKEEDNLYFYLARPNNSRLWINGQEVLGKNGTSISAYDCFRLNSYPGDGVYKFVLQISNNNVSGNGYQTILVGSKETLNIIRNRWIQLDSIAVGLSLMLILLCLALFFHKRSEVYLPMLLLSTVMELAHFLAMPRLPLVVPFHWGWVAFYGQFTFINYFICKQFVPNTASKSTDWMVYLTVVFSALGCIISPIHSTAILRYTYMFYTMMQVWLLSKGVLRGISEVAILLLGCMITMGGEIFYTLLNTGLIPQGVVDVQILPAQYFRFAYLVTFAIATCQKFASKFSEADILASNLERQVKEQTKELRASQEHLNAIQQKRQQFMIDVVHNLRSPLFALGGYVDLLRDEWINPEKEQEKYVDLIDKKIKFVSHMVDDMFFISRLEDGKIEFHFTEFDLASFLEGALQDAEAKSVAKRVQVICICEPEEIIIIGDPFRLRQALDNILDNAIRYSPTGGTITIHGILDGSDRICISVMDNGPGISNEKQARLFERYISKGEGGQSGLGLSIASFIVKEHHGNIVVKSEQGKGSTFTMVLPLSK